VLSPGGGLLGCVCHTHTHIRYADDLTLLADAPGALHNMLNRLVVCTFQNLTINTANSEVVHFNLKRGIEVPISIEAGGALKCSDLLRYLGVTFHQTLNMTALSEHAARPMLVAACCVLGFAPGLFLPCDSSK